MSESVGTEYLASVALDSKQGLLYYADKQNGFIGEMTTEGNQSRRLFNGITKSPHAIVVDSNNRLTNRNHILSMLQSLHYDAIILI